MRELRGRAAGTGRAGPAASRRQVRVAASAAALAVALAACTGSPAGPAGAPPTVQADLQREPVASGDLLPSAAAEGLWLPYQIEQLALVTPPWPAGAAREQNGTFLAPAEIDGAVEFRAVDSEGTALWWAQRPASCTGFVLATTSGGQDIAVLTDLEETSGGFVTTASAYDLHTGEQVWGPVEVPGPHRGPGLVYADMPATFGEPDGAVALDADTGQVLEGSADAQPIGEYDGVVVTAEGTHLTASEPSPEVGRSIRWAIPLAEQGWSASNVTAVAGTNPGPGVALLDVGSDAHALLDLTDGDVLADGVRDVVTDAATGTRVVLTEDRLRGIDSEGAALWDAPAGDAQFQAVGGALVYLLDDGAVRVHNTLTGEVAIGYNADGSGEIALPALIAPTGAALLTVADIAVLATIRPAESAPDERR